MKKVSWRIKNQLIEIEFPAVMGVLNLTPDSFYPESRVNNIPTLLDKIDKMIHDGATIIDLGAVSTRPGSKPPSEHDEILRLIPAIKAVHKAFPNILISVDTFRAKVAKMAIENGAHIVNDISGGTLDPKMFETISQLQVPYILMHIQGTPETMQLNPTYNDLILDINYFFSKQIHLAHQAGIHDIVIDVGLGFGKTLEHNYQLVKNLQAFKIHEKPIMLGISRKSMIYKVLQSTPEEALFGTIAMQTIALLNGVDILRVHDVKAAIDSIKIVQKYLSI